MSVNIQNKEKKILNVREIGSLETKISWTSSQNLDKVSYFSSKTFLDIPNISGSFIFSTQIMTTDMYKHSKKNPMHENSNSQKEIESWS